MYKFCTTIEQSKKLMELGIDRKSSDMYYFLDPTPAGNIYHLTVQRVDVGIKNLPNYNEGDIPCWSLATLLNILDFPLITQEKKQDKLEFCLLYYNNYEYIEITADNPVDACVAMIIKLKNLNLL